MYIGFEFLCRGRNPGSPMFLQDGHNISSLVFMQRGQTQTLSRCHCVTDMYVTMVLERYNVHVVQLGHKVFYAN